jgi:hypothetical protein
LDSAAPIARNLKIAREKGEKTTSCNEILKQSKASKTTSTANVYNNDNNMIITVIILIIVAINCLLLLRSG